MPVKLLIAVLGVGAGVALALILKRDAPRASRVFYHDPVTMAVIGGIVAFGLAATFVENKVEWSQAVTQVTTAEALDALVASANGQPVLVDFYATWCGPCRSTAPNVNAIAAEGHRVAVVDVDAAQALAQQYQVESIPTLLVFRDGKLVRTELGYHSEEELRALLKG